MVYQIFIMLYMLVLQYILNIVLHHGYKGRQIQLCASKKFYLKHVEINHATFFSLWFWCYWKASARWPVLCCPLLHQGTFPEHQLKIEETVLSYSFFLQYLPASSFGKEGYVMLVCLSVCEQHYSKSYERTVVGLYGGDHVVQWRTVTD